MSNVEDIIRKIEERLSAPGGPEPVGRLIHDLRSAGENTMKYQSRRSKEDIEAHVRWYKAFRGRAIEEEEELGRRAAMESSYDSSELMSRDMPVIQTQEDKMTPTAFISYSWDSPAHKKWVLDFATRLRKDGVATVLDYWHSAPGDQLPQFMERSIRENDFVLIICTPRYKEKADGRLGGVGYEGNIMTGELFNTGNERKFIPILRSGNEQSAMPTWLSGKNYIRVSGLRRWTSEYNRLLQCLLGLGPIAPPVGYERDKKDARAKNTSGETHKVPAIKPTSEFEDLRGRVQAIDEPRREAERRKRALVEGAEKCLLRFDAVFKEIAEALSHVTGNKVMPEYDGNTLAGLKRPAGYMPPPIWYHTLGVSDWMGSVHFFTGIEGALAQDSTLELWAAYGLGGKSVMYHELWTVTRRFRTNSDHAEKHIQEITQGLTAQLRPAIESFVNQIERIEKVQSNVLIPPTFDHPGQTKDGLIIAQKRRPSARRSLF